MAFSVGGDGEADVVVDLGLSPEALAGITKAIVDAIGEGFTKAFSSAEFTSVFKRFAQQASDSMGKATEGTKKAQQAEKDLLSTLEKVSLQFINVAREAGNATGAIVAASNRVRTNERQNAITAREELSRQLQIRQALIDRETKQIAQQSRTQGELQVNAAKVAGKQRVQITRSVLETIGRLEKLAFAGIAGLARTTTSAISRTFAALQSTLNRTASSVTRIFTNNTLQTDLRTRESLISRSFHRQERELRSSVIRQQAILAEAQRKTSTGALGALTGRGVGGGVGLLAGGAGLVGLLTSGFQRFSDLERINKQFLALTGNITDTNKLLAEVKKFAKETPFDLVGVADLAKGFLAMKTPLDQVLPRIQAIADAVALTGGGTAELTRIQRALGQIFSRGVLQGDELNQLSESLPGINITQLLADQITGGNTALLLEMKEAGELSADATINALITGLTNDPRIAGAAKAIADTVGGRLANLKESFADFGASLIGVIETPLKAAFAGTQVVLQGLADFIKGENLGPLLTIVRDGLKGVAIALGLIFAAKAGVQVIQLLGLAVSALLSPLGALIVVASAVGAAISIMWDRSEDFREALSSLGRYLSTQGSRIFDAFTEAIETVRAAFTGTHEAVTGTADRLAREVEPASNTFRDFADIIKKALFNVTTFIVDKAIPAIASFAIFIGQNIVPAAKAAAGFIERTALAVAHLADSIAIKLRPFLQPAIDGFKALGSAIAAAFGGDFSGLGDGARSALSGIGNTVAGIATAVGEALLPAGQKVLDFFSNLFSGPNLKKYASAFLGFVEEAGRIIGTLVTHPSFVKAALAIGAAAVVIGVRFIEGLGRGIISNIPGLFDLLADGLQSGFRAVLDNPAIIAGVLAAGLVLKKLFQIIGVTAGTEMATGASKGFRAKVGSAGGFLGGLPARGASSALFFKSLFDGDAFTKYARDQGFKAGKELQRSFFSNKNLLTAAGAPSIAGGTRFGLPFISQADATDQANRVAALRNRLGEVGFAALEARAKVLATTTAIGGMGRALGGIGRNITFASSAGRGPFGSLLSGFKQTMTDIQVAARQSGLTVGQALGNAVKGAATAALAGVGGFLAGKAAGESGQGAAFSAITAGLTGLAIRGPVVGAVSAGAALIGNAFGSAGAKAREFRERVKSLTEALKTELSAAIEQGVLDLDKLKRGILGFADVSDLDSIQKIFSDILGDKGKAGLDTFDLGFGDIQKVIESGGDLDTLKQKMQDTFLAGATSSDAFNEAFGAMGSTVKGYLTDFLASGGGSFEDLYNQIAQGIGPSFAFSDLDKALLRNDDLLSSLVDTAGKFGPAFDAAAASIAAINREGRTGFFGDDVDTSGIEGGITTVETRLGAIDILLAGLIEKKKDFFGRNPEGDNTTQKIIDSGVLAAANLGQQQAQVKGGTFGSVGNTVDDATLRKIDEDLQTTIATAIDEGIKNGSVKAGDEASVKAIAQPIIDAFIAELPAAQQEITRAALEAGIPAIVPTVEDTQALLEGQQLNEDLKAIFANAPPEVTFSVATAQLLLDTGNSANAVQAYMDQNPAVAKLGFDQAAVALVGSQLSSGLNESFNAAGGTKQAGRNAVIGLINGIEEKTADARAAARRLAAAVTNAAVVKLKISSPSKVFQEIGRFIGEGLIIGIEDSSSAVSQAITSAIDKAITAARFGGDKVRQALAEAGAGLFGSLTGSDSPLGTTGTLNAALAGITTATQSLLSTFDSNLAKVFEVNSKPFASLSKADQDIFGESLFSLNPDDVIGASNLAALTGAFDSIAQLGETLLEQGIDAATVAARMEAEVQKLIAAAVGLGFNGEQVQQLAEALGLSSTALDEFIQQLEDLANSVSDGGSIQTSLPLARGPVDVPADRPARVDPQINNYIYLPSGDPKAAALAVANRQASSLFG